MQTEGTAQSAPASATKGFEPAWRDGRAWALLLAVIVIGVAVDLVSKSIAFDRVAGERVEVTREAVLAAGPQHLRALVPDHPPLVVVPHVLNLELVLNAGAVFGAGQGRRGFFIAFTVAALAFGAWLFARWTDRRDRVAQVGIGLVVAGGLGNLYDRLLYACVRDFLHPLPTARLPWGLRWPGGEGALWPYVSNVADALLILGIVLLVTRMWGGNKVESGKRKVEIQTEPRP